MSALNNFIYLMLTSHPLSSGLGVEVGVPFSAQDPVALIRTSEMAMATRQTAPLFGHRERVTGEVPN